MKFHSILVFAVCLCLFAAPFAAKAPADEEGDEGMWGRIKRFDKDGDGRVTREEMGRGGRMFDRLDKDADGAISKVEAMAAPARGDRGGMGGRSPGGGERPGGRGEGTGGLPLGKLDTNKDGAVSKPEWESFFKKADENEDGILQKEEWDAAVGGGHLHDPAPAVGANAPKVSAMLFSTTASVDLSAPKRTTVLIFGSWT